MIRRLPLPWLSYLVVSLFTLPPAWGQTPARSPFQLPPNPQHEKSKTDAQNAHAQGDYEKAVELTNSVIRANPADHVAYYLRSSARIELGQVRGDARPVRDGIADSREAIKLTDAKNVTYYLPYLYGMTTLAALEGKPAHAEISVKIAGDVLLRTGISTEEKANLLYQRAIANTYLQKFADAVKDHEAAIAAMPSHFGSRIGLAHAHIAAGNQEKALEAFGSLIKTYPDNPQVYNDRGSYLQELGRYDEAVIDFSRAVELEPAFTVGYLNRGFALLASGDANSAENDFSTAIKTEPENTLAITLRGDARLAQRRLDEAAADYLRVTQIEPSNPNAAANVGFARFLAGDYPAAAAAFRNSVTLNAQMRFLEPWRAQALVLAGGAANVKTQFQQSLAKPPEQRDWIDQLIRYAVGEGADEELLAAVYQKDPQIQVAQTCEAHFFIGRRKLAAGDTDAAAADFRKSVETKQSHLYAYRAAAFLLKQK